MDAFGRHVLANNMEYIFSKDLLILNEDSTMYLYLHEWTFANEVEYSPEFTRMST